jgi:hypothetical protein
VLGVAWDADTGEVRHFQNGVVVFDCTIPVGTHQPCANHCNDACYHCAATASFGAAPLKYTPPPGYSPLD